MEKIKLDVYDLKGKVVDNVQLDSSVFDGRVNEVLLYEVNKMYEANKRRGTASTKTRAEVSGGGAKPWRQKGTGRARVGSSRNPIWRHGGVTFGPKPRDFGFTMPKKAVKKALVSSINARLNEKMVKSIVKLEMAEPKTKEFKQILDSLNLAGSTLLVVGDVNDGVRLSARNLKKVSMKNVMNINARDVLLNDNIIIEKDALGKLTERLK